MVLCDVGVLLQAAMSKSAHHELCRRRTAAMIGDGRSFAVSELILAAVVRIATNPRAFDPPSSVDSAFAFVRALRDHERAVTIGPGGRHWEIFEDLVRAAGIRGSDTTDAYLAALALEHGCEWWTTDRDFARFPGLRCRNLLELA
jgi:uncharacterized protein